MSFLFIFWFHFKKLKQNFIRSKWFSIKYVLRNNIYTTTFRQLSHILKWYSYHLSFFLSIIFRLNCNFNPLTFPKLRFWSPKEKTTKQPPKFCNSFGPQNWYWLGLRWCGTLTCYFFNFFFALGGQNCYSCKI